MLGAAYVVFHACFFVLFNILYYMTPFPPFLPQKKTSPKNYDYDDVTEFLIGKN